MYQASHLHSLLTPALQNNKAVCLVQYVCKCHDPDLQLCAKLDFAFFSSCETMHIAALDIYAHVHVCSSLNLKRSWIQTVHQLITLCVWLVVHYSYLKPQDSFGESTFFFFLIFRKCRKSSENNIKPSCNCFEYCNVILPRGKISLCT